MTPEIKELDEQISTFGNATPGRPNYTGNNIGGAREGDDQHKNYTGAGFQAQIDRRTV